MTTEERLNRIEGLMTRIAERHIELEDAQVSIARAHSKLEHSLASFIDETKNRIDGLNDRIGNLTILVDGIARAQDRTDRALERLTGVQEQTEYKLNALIDTVDRIVRDRKD